MHYTRNAIDLVRAHAADYLANVHGIESPTKRHFRCLHPGHDDRHPSMILNPRSNRLHCFGCGADVDVIDVAGWDTGATDFRAKLSAAATGEGIDIDALETTPARTAAPSSATSRTVDPPPDELDGPNVLDAVFRAAEDLFGERGTEALRRLRGRGFSDEDIFGSGLGWCGHPADVMPGKLLSVPRMRSGYVVIPYPDNPSWSSVRYCAFRPVGPSCRAPKELKPGGLPAVVYREHYLRGQGVLNGKVYVTEGPFDAIALSAILHGASTCAIGGGGTGRLLAVLARVPAQSRPGIVLAFDRDSAGEKYTAAAKSGLAKLGIPCCALDPYPCCAKDPNDLLKAIRKEALIA